MKKKTSFSAAFAVACLLLNTYAVKAQLFANWDFQQIYFNNSCGAPSWIVSNNPAQQPQQVGMGSSTNPPWYDPTWIDLTPCTSFGNGAWLMQTVPTTPGTWYDISMSLGTWYGWAYDAGVDVYVDGNPLNAGTSRLYNNVFSNINPHWQKAKSCMFLATSNATTIKFVGNGQVPSNPPPAGPGVMGIDSLWMDSVGVCTLATSLGAGCNNYCFTITNNMVGANSAPTANNIQWYIDDVLQQGNGLTFCKLFPKGSSKQIKVTFNTGCAAYTQTLLTTVTATQNCCDIQSYLGLTVTRTDCNVYNVSPVIPPGYALTSAQWKRNGVNIPGTVAGANLTLSSPGIYTICAFVVGSAPGAPPVTCTASACTTISIPWSFGIVKTVTYCPLSAVPPTYNPCLSFDCNGSVFDYYYNNIYQGSSCTAYPLNSSSEVRCYEVLPNGKKCLTSVIDLNLQTALPNSSQQPDQTISTCSTSAAYVLNCGPGYTHYRVKGPGGTIQNSLFGPVNLSLAPGNHTLECINLNNCSSVMKVVHVLQQSLATSFSPDETIIGCGTEVPYSISCGGAYTHFKIQGPNVNSQGSLSLGFPTFTLTAGDYTVECINYGNCTAISKIVHVSLTPWTITNSPAETAYACDGTSIYFFNCGAGYSSSHVYNSTTDLQANLLFGLGVAVLSPGVYTVDCINNSNCSINRRIVTVVPQQINMVYSANEVIYTCNSTFAYTVPCSSPYARYRITGTGISLEGDLNPGPAVINLAPDTYTIDCINYQNCTKNRRVVQILVGPIVTTAANETLTICSPNVTYTIQCGLPYSTYQITGPLLNSQGSLAGWPVTVLLYPGTYTLDCIDNSGCHTHRKLIAVTEGEMRYNTCQYADIIRCPSQITESEPASRVMSPPCFNNDCLALMSSNAGPGTYTLVSFSPPLSVYTRAYIDESKCMSCVVTFTYTKTPVQPIVINVKQQGCITINNDNLPVCLQDQDIKAVLVGQYDNIIAGNAGEGIQLCCGDAGSEKTYYIYSDYDPCCIALITIKCVNGFTEKTSGINPSETENEALLKIVPNPTSALFHILSANGMDDYEKMTIVDLNGRVVLTKGRFNSRTLIDASKLGKGTYAVTIKTVTGLVTLKLILMNE